MVGILFAGILENNVVITTKSFFDAIVESIDDEIVVLDPFKSNKLIKHIPQNIKVRKMWHLFECNCWNDVDKKTQELLKGIKVK